MAFVNRIFSGRAVILAACCASGLNAAACASTAPPAILSETTWIVQSIDGRPVTSRQPTIEFSGDRISGSGSCNRYFGTYEVSGTETIVLGGIGSTEMACELPLMTQEAAFFSALNAVRAYRRDGDTLILSAVSGSQLVLRRAP